MNGKTLKPGLIFFLAFILVVNLFPFEISTAPLSPATRQRVDWIRDNAVAVRSIDPADEDFSDLMPLVDLIGEARIVQLGEASHGAGTEFKTKARLIRFLHRVMGFDVLVWESGMYDCRAMNRALRAGTPPMEACALGIFSIWALEETRPLFEYSSDSFSSGRPLEMAGFDEQFSSRDAALRFHRDLAAFLDAIEPGYPDPDTRRALAAHLESLNGRQLDGDGFEQLKTSVEKISEAFRKDPSVLLRRHSPREAAFFQRALANLLIYAGTTAERAQAKARGEDYLVNKSWNARDRQNAENLLWLANEYFRGRKLIVWAHNGHVMNCVYKPDWRSVSLERGDAGMIPVGVFLHEALGDQVYTVGFLGYHGRHGIRGVNPVDIPPFPEDALESLCFGTGLPHLFLDFRRLDDDPGHWLRHPLRMGGRSYFAEELPDWTRAYDAVFFNAEIAPGTPISKPAEKKPAVAEIDTSPALP